MTRAVLEKTIECGRVYDLDPRRVKPFADQPRKRFRGIPKLAESIRAVGQVTPIEVTACDDPDFDAELVDGERRLRACLSGGMTVRAVFSDTRQEDRYVRSVAANFCRQGHDAVEIMEVVCRLKDAGRDNETIAKVFGKTASWVTQYASLRGLHPEVLEELKIAGDEQVQSRGQLRRRGRMTLSLALLLVPLPAMEQLRMMRSIRDAKMPLAEARTFVRKAGAKRGVKLGKTQSPRSKLHALRTAVQNCTHVVDRHLDMPGTAIGPIISSVSRTERRQLAGQLDTLCSSLLMFHDALIEGN